MQELTIWPKEELKYTPYSKGLFTKILHTEN